MQGLALEATKSLLHRSRQVLNTTAGSVDRIAGDGVAHVMHVNPDLVRAAGLEPNPQPSEVRIACAHRKVRKRVAPLPGYRHAGTVNSDGARWRHRLFRGRRKCPPRRWRRTRAPPPGAAFPTPGGGGRRGCGPLPGAPKCPCRDDARHRLWAVGQARGSDAGGRWPAYGYGFPPPDARPAPPPCRPRSAPNPRRRAGLQPGPVPMRLRWARVAPPPPLVLPPRCASRGWPCGRRRAPVLPVSSAEFGSGNSLPRPLRVPCRGGGRQGVREGPNSVSRYSFRGLHHAGSVNCLVRISSLG